MEIRIQVSVPRPGRWRTGKSGWAKRALVVLGVVTLVVPGVAYGTHSFTDVPSDAFYHDGATAMKGAGITAGCGDGSTFCPDTPLTRAQMAAFLARSLPRSAQSTTLLTQTFSFDNTPKDIVKLTITVPGTGTATQYVDVRGHITVHDNGVASGSCPCKVSVFLRDVGGLNDIEDQALTMWPNTYGTSSDYQAISINYRFSATPGAHTYALTVNQLAPASGAGTLRVSNGQIQATTVPFGSTGNSAP